MTESKSLRTRPRPLGEGFRWFGPADPVPLAHIRQTGARHLFHSLHEIPYGDVWPSDAIHARKAQIKAAGLCWTVVESLPIHETIKTGIGPVDRLLENYCQSLRNLSEAGIHTVIYNFMPVLDWVRTDMNWLLPDGSRCLHFDPVRLAAFDLHALQRCGAGEDYSDAQKEAAAAWWHSLSQDEKKIFIRSIIDVFPGVKWNLSLNDIRRMLESYEGIGTDALRTRLKYFLEAVIPTAEAVGIRLAIHPDDPPFSVLGLPRIVSTPADVDAILTMAESPANGLCFCSGSFDSRGDNDLVAMAQRFGPRIHAAHLRNTQRLPNGCFYESGHLEGSADMAAIVRTLLQEQSRRQKEGRSDWQIAFRPDHGSVMMDDLMKPVVLTPGYPAIGRMRGLAEIRGLMAGLTYEEH